MRKISPPCPRSQSRPSPIRLKIQPLLCQAKSKFCPNRLREHFMIELIEFGKDYGDFTAVGSISLKINAGEMYGFIGPNGAGKSTSIRFLATLLKASRGEGIVNG